MELCITVPAEYVIPLLVAASVAGYFLIGFFSGIAGLRLRLLDAEQGEHVPWLLLWPVLLTFSIILGIGSLLEWMMRKMGGQ